MSTITTRLLAVSLLVAVLGPTARATGPDDPFPAADPASQGVPAEALADIASTVAGWVERGDAVGAELLIVKNRRTILHETFGWRDEERELPMEPHTIFNIRSMTKPLTGAAAQILVEEGALDLDDPVAKHVPAFDTDEARMITVRQLLTHRSGLPLTVFTTGINEYPDLGSIAAAAGAGGPRFEPDSKFWYSDAGSDVAGAVVAKVAGERLDLFVTRRLLEPLGMRDSLYVIDADDPRLERIASLYAGTGGAWQKLWEPTGEPFYPFAWGSQSLYSTPRDYARFLAMWMDEGMAGDTRVLSSAAVDRTLTPVSPMTSLGSDEPFPTFFEGLDVFYGQMAVLYLESGAPEGTGPVVIGHSGSDGTMAWAWPELDLMVLYFTQSRGGLSGLRLEEEIDRRLLHPERAVASTSDEVPPELAPFLGTYVANFGPFRNTEFTCLVRDGRLAVDVPGQLVFELKDPDEAGKRSFVISDEVAVSFDRAEDGTVTGMKMYQAGLTFELPKGSAEDVPEPVVDLEAARKYVGSYLDEDGGEVRVIIRGEGLAVEIAANNMVLDLYPPDDEGFWSLRMNASVRLRFDEDEDGNVVSYTVLLPDGTEQVRRRVSLEPATK